MVRIVVIAGLVLASSLTAGCADSSTASGRAEVVAVKSIPKIRVVDRTRALAGYPCQQCHQHAENGEGTVVNSHAEIQVKHMPDGRCETCHYPDQPGKLKLAGGTVIDLEKALELCAQCHSTQAADWSLGIHGKQVGNWQIEIHRYACTSCHDAHAPKFGSMDALAAPPFPAFGIPKGAH